MSRWSPLFGAAWAVSLLAGCSTSIEPGLANAPRLGGIQTADERVNDAISNGGDSCGRYAEHGPLRARLPPCPTVTHPLAASFLVQSPTGKESLVGPWLEHFYVDWLTRPQGGSGASGSKGAASR
jgi:hypothetical protein